MFLAELWHLSAKRILYLRISFNAFQRISKDFFASATKAEEIRLGYVDGKDLLKRSTDEILNGFAYYCMAKKPDNILMWSHYADSHKGVCFRFDLLQDSSARFLLRLIEGEAKDT